MLLRFRRNVWMHWGRWGCGLGGGFWRGRRKISSPQQVSHWEISAASHSDSCYLPSELRWRGRAVAGGRQKKENLDGVAFLIVENAVPYSLKRSEEGKS